MTCCRLVWLFACLSLIPSLAVADVYRCTENGKAVYSDKPCAGDTVKVPIPGAARSAVDPASANLQNEAGMGRIAVGMTPDQVEEAWGRPAEKKTDKDAHGTTQRWTYIRNGDATDIVIKNGTVSKIGDPRRVAASSRTSDEPARPTASDVENSIWLDEERERLEKSDERRFIREGMTHEEVWLRIGPPANIKESSPTWGAGTYWIYPPAYHDPQTTTIIRFDRDGGHVISVRREVEH